MRPIHVASGSRPKSLTRRPERAARSARNSAARPAPAAQLAVNALMRSGCMRNFAQPRIMSLHPVLLDVHREVGQRGEDAAVVLVVGAQLEAISLGDFQG